MLNKEELTRYMEERLTKMEKPELCAVFLASAEDRTGQEAEQQAEAFRSYMTTVLDRIFHKAQGIADMGNGSFGVFCEGHLTERMIMERAWQLGEALGFPGTLPDMGFQGYVGIYVFQPLGKTAEQVLLKADYALEMAKQTEEYNFYIHTEEALQFSLPEELISAHLLFHYMDEGIRILDEEAPEAPLFVSHGFYRRLGLYGREASPDHILIHPSDRAELLERVREVARRQTSLSDRCRFSKDGNKWCSCDLYLMPIAVSQNKTYVLEVSYNVSGLRQLKEHFYEKDEWLRFIARQTDYQLWDADLRTGVFRLLYTNGLLGERQTVYENFPESLIESGRVHKDSAESFLRFAEGMLHGAADGSENFMIQYRQSSCYGWANMSYHTLYDENGRPERVIGIKRDLSYLPEQQSGTRRRNMPQQLYPHLFGFVQANLSKDLVETVQVEGVEQSRLVRVRSFTELMQRACKRLFASEDMERIRSRFSREYLLEECGRGRHFFFDQCRMVNKSGDIQWIAIGVNLVFDFETGEVCLFGYLSDETARKEWEQSLKTEIGVDPGTGLYQEKTGRALMKKLLAQYKNTCSLAEIRLFGADEILKDESYEQKYLDIVTAMQFYLDTDCVPIRLEDGNLEVFFPNSISKPYMQRRIENAFSFVRMSLKDMPEIRLLRFVAGVAFRSAGTADYDEMSATVSELCTLHSGEANDMVAFADENEKYTWSSQELTGQSQGLQLQQKDTMPGRLMTDADKSVALECMKIMLQAESETASIDGVLRKLGLYYQADRVYILTLAENGNVVTMLNEWTGKGRYSISQSISGKKISHFPVLARYAKKKSPTLLTIRKNHMEGQQEDQDFWQYTIYPMEFFNGSKRLLCIENPRRPIEQTALLEEITPFLENERKRFLAYQKNTSTEERYANLANAEAYRNAVDSMNSDTLSSMGVLTVEIPDYVSVKAYRGYDYLTRVLIELSEILSDTFGIDNIFHTEVAEFIALCSNITYEAFLDCCARVRQSVNHRYPGQFRFGYTWSEKIFEGKDLVKKAQDIMKCSTPDPSILKERMEDAEKRRPEEMPSMHFMIYLQPKVEMRSGRLVGAEALARITDDSGALLPHSRIIASMEEEHTIQNLDYFVFDKTLATLNSWREKGYPTIPLSSNFSRNTLLNPSSLASLLAILSRYPEVPQNLMEIEITETAGSFENNTFSEIIRQFGKYGIQFSLDDFGAGYSNLGMLSDLSFHSVKLDRSMVKNITQNQISRSVVRDTARLCRENGMICIAEGVETRNQAEILLENGCDYAQGFYYGRPMPLEEFENRYFNAEGGSL